MCRSLFHFTVLHTITDNPKTHHEDAVRTLEKASYVQAELNAYVSSIFVGAGAGITSTCDIVVAFVGEERVLQLLRGHVITQGSHTRII